MGKVVEKAAFAVSGVPYGGSVSPGELVGWSSNKLVRAYGAAGGVVAAVGVAAAAYEDGDTGAYFPSGEVSGFSGLSIGAAQYVSLSEPGGVQSVTPSGAGNWKQAVGYAVAADRVVVTLQDAGVSI